jgi:hypothetical protein
MLPDPVAAFTGLADRRKKIFDETVLEGGRTKCFITWGTWLIPTFRDGTGADI